MKPSLTLLAAVLLLGAHEKIPISPFHIIGALGFVLQGVGLAVILFRLASKFEE